VEAKKQNQIKISNMFAVVENLYEDVDNNRAWESIRQNIKASATESLGYYEFETA
jgi:hypothetical protein